ncbi:MAG: M14 family zinc carboxypeptidase [bacterium]|nr:M14 family zinc carboxypeptidase [bacterium]
MSSYNRLMTVKQKGPIYMKFIALNRFYYYNDLINDSSMLKIAYPDLITTKFIGNTASNRSILMLRIGRGKKGILMTGGVHGRESINPVVLMAMLEYYALAYSDEVEQLAIKTKTGVDIKEFFKEYSLYVIPLLNPDGYMIALRGYNIIHNEEARLKAKAFQIPYSEWKANVNGIDINRNFPSLNFKEKFEGDVPASELETKALIRLFEEVETEVYLDFHSRGKQIFYYRKQMSKEYNEKSLKIARRLQEATGYELVEPEGEIESNDSGGNTVHYYSEVFHKPALTIETVPEPAKFPLALKYQRMTYSEILYVPFLVV